MVDSYGASKLTWERSSPVGLNPDKNFTVDALEKQWSKMGDFTNAETPDGPMDLERLLKVSQALPGSDSVERTRFDGKVVIVTGAASG